MNNKIAIITPAYNEEKNIGRLVSSILKQELLPTIWIIVNDDSTDSTGQIIDDLATKYSFIHAVHNKKRMEIKNYYAHKIIAFNKGYEHLKCSGIDYDFIGNLDADISMDSDYYRSICNEFENNSILGIAGGIYRYEGQKESVPWNGNYVPGSILMTRRTCFEEIGGYKPLKYGLEDTLLCMEAEAIGWEVRIFEQYQVVQHRQVGSAEKNSAFRIFFRQGLGEQKIGYTFIYELSKFINRMNKDRPFILASLYRFLGFLAGFLTASEGTNVSAHAKAHLKRTQLNRLATRQ